MFNKPCLICQEKEKRITEFQAQVARLINEIKVKDAQILAQSQTMLDMVTTFSGRGDNIIVTEPQTREYDLFPLGTGKEENE